MTPFKRGDIVTYVFPKSPEWHGVLAIVDKWEAGTRLLGRKWGTSMEFKRGDVVWCDPELGEATSWLGLAVVHSCNDTRGDMAVGLQWIAGNPIHFYNHADGCDAYVPIRWLTKVEGVVPDGIS